MEHRSRSPLFHLHSLGRSTLEFEVPASIFADFPRKGSFGLDQEMSLLSHSELKAVAKQEEMTVLGKLRPATNCCGGGTLPSLSQLPQLAACYYNPPAATSAVSS